MSLPLPVGTLAAGSPGLLWQVALTRWAARQLAVSLSASPGQRANPGNCLVALEDAQESLCWAATWASGQGHPATGKSAMQGCTLALSTRPRRWRIDPLLHGSADKDNCAAAELNAMYHGRSNTHMATHLRLMPFPMANCTVEVSTASATQSPLANAQHKHANKTHVQRNWGDGSTSNAKNKAHANANANANGNV